MHRVVAFLIGLVLACDAAVLTVRLLDRYSGRGEAAVPVTETTVEIVPAANQVFVTGEITRLVSSAARTPDALLPVPLTLMTLDRGSSRARVEGALVDGSRMTISWDGGVPLPVSGEGGSLDLGLARLRIDEEGVSWLLDGAPRRLVPGTYRLGATVALSGSGLARPRDGIVFEADEQTVLVAQNGVVVQIDSQALQLLGPGEVELEGSLDLRFGSGERSAETLRSAEGPYELSLEPTESGYRVDGIIQAEVVAE